MNQFEDIIYQSKPHKMMLGWLLPAGVFWVWLFWGLWDSQLWMWLSIVGGAIFFYYLMTYTSTSYTIAENRIIVQRTFSTTTTKMVYFDNLKNFQIEQGPLGQHFKYGKITIWADSPAPITLTYVKDVHLFCEHLNAQIAKTKKNE